MIFIYVIKLDRDKHYTGITKNLINRLQQHHKKQSKFTSHYNIISLNYIATAKNYQSARRLEKQIKQFRAGKYINKIKFSDRYYLDIKINKLIYLDSSLTALKQLKIINSFKIHF